jgi:2-polyprenyl-3-methyl-5-hydroxy-6-metoxy-1,4-benzoquinol methylase
MNREKEIIESWEANAANWIQIVEADGIESRRLVTNRAIVEAVCANGPQTVLDIGCGEGWLAKAMADRGIMVTGIDIVPELIEKARKKAIGNFIVASYEDMATHKTNLQNKFDSIIINFALIGKASTEELLASLPFYLKENGQLIIQTLHPFSRKAIDDYVSGWKQGSWDGLGGQFVLPYQWYFRTLEDWLDLLHQSGFNRINFTEPLHPGSRCQLSILFECRIK